MKKGLITFVIGCLMCSTAWAATVLVNLDVQGWTQEQKNLLVAAAVSLLHENGSADRPTEVKKQQGELTFTDPVSDVQAILTQLAVENKINEIIVGNIRTPEEILADEVDSYDITLRELVIAYTQVLRSKLAGEGVNLAIADMEELIRHQLKVNRGLTQ
jgi:hypothetical protein